MCVTNVCTCRAGAGLGLDWVWQRTKVCMAHYVQLSAGADSGMVSGVGQHPSAGHTAGPGLEAPKGLRRLKRTLGLVAHMQPYIQQAQGRKGEKAGKSVINKRVADLHEYVVPVQRLKIEAVAQVGQAQRGQLEHLVQEVRQHRAPGALRALAGRSERRRQRPHRGRVARAWSPPQHSWV